MENFCNFASVFKLLYQNINKYAYPNGQPAIKSEDDCLSALFNQYSLNQEPLSPTLGCKYLTNARKVSGKIKSYYGKSPDELLYDVTDQIIPRLKDLHETVIQLSDLVSRDAYMTNLKKASLLAYLNQPEHFITKVIEYAMQQPMKPKSPKRALRNSFERETELFIAEVNFTCPVPSPCRYFCGRTQEMDELHAMLEEHKHIFVRGLAGIGKSELVKKFAEQHREEYDSIIYLNYHDSLQSTIASLSVSLDNPRTTFQKHYRMLQELSRKSLLIIDNFNTTAEQEPDLRLLLDLHCRIIISTRSAFHHAPTYELKEMQNTDNLFQLFSSFYQGTEKYQGIVSDVITCLHSHTYAVELAARLMAQQFYTPAEILKKLHENALNQSLKDQVYSEKDNRDYRDILYGHIHLLFRLFDLEHDLHYVLQCSFFFPQSGIHLRKAAEWVELDQPNAFRKLDEIGLIRITPENSVQMYPMVREIVYADLTPSLNDCQPFLKHIYDICNTLLTAIPDQQLVDTVTEIGRKLQYRDESDVLLFLEVAFGYLEQSSFRSEMMILSKIYTDLVQNMESPDKQYLAKMYYIQSCAASLAEKDVAEGIRLANKALALADHVGLEFEANMHHNLGFLYRLNGQTDQSQAELQRADAIRAEIGEESFNTLATKFLMHMH